jgi:hypothetical protein
LSERRLTIRPHGEGRFAIFDGDALLITGARYEVEDARERWQAEIDAGGEPDMFIGGLIPPDEETRAEVAAQRAEIERLKATIKTSSEQGRDGWKKSRKTRQNETLARRNYANGLIIEAVKTVPGSPRPDVFDWVQRHWKADRWKCYERSSIYGLINGLVEIGALLLKKDGTLLPRK